MPTGMYFGMQPWTWRILSPWGLFAKKYFLLFNYLTKFFENVPDNLRLNFRPDYLKLLQNFDEIHLDLTDKSVEL